MVSNISDEQVIKLFRKYEKQTMDCFVGVVKDNYVLEEDKLNQYGIWDEMFCKMSDEEFCSDVLDGISDSVGVEEYGIEEVDDE